MTGRTIHTERIVLNARSFDWMVGRTVCSIEFFERDHWVVSLSNGGSIVTDSLWRVLDATRLLTTSLDHAQLYGLTESVDAGHRAVHFLSSSRILEVDLKPAHSDLTVEFENGMAFQFLSTSIGYESWQVEDPEGICIVMDGAGNASTWKV